MATYVGNALQAHANGGCYVCARGDSLIDLGVDIVGEGALTLCKGCIAEAAEAAELTFNRARIRELEAELATLTTELTLATARRIAFDSAIAAATTDAPSPPPSAVACAATTKAGAPCKGVPVTGTDLCMSHS